MKIPLIDLKEQYLAIKNEIDDAVSGVLSSGHYILGPNVRALEAEIAAFCNTSHAVGVANGTDALVLSLRAFDIGAGDEVITTPFTFFATAEAISQVEATPVFVDIDRNSYNMDPGLIEEKITEKTRAILPVHIFGRMADMDPIMDVAKKYGLYVIEDACQAIGAKYRGKYAGSIGHAGCLSFFPTKNLGGYGDGGMVVTGSPEAAKKIQVLRAHGSTQKYHHAELGYNSRLDELQAAILRVKLKHLGRWNELRREKAGIYNSLLKESNLTLPAAGEVDSHVYHLYVVATPHRDACMHRLKAAGIACGVYYPVPLHQQQVYRSMYTNTRLPVSEAACRDALALPMYPEISRGAIEQVISVLLNKEGIYDQNPA